ncbi:tetracycline resistance MFS efflux pump [Dictyobacter arantiisoli]|uniref:Tetracycline resistance MFS efflux pump n=2 Tax=Dictyobacter arantiisoli TaxID=2014874 RepID=A0A5A5TKX4_9CHLR|nr:tetracycline resistance MFS efflux pump [Dictyobacter arantiisoli]
MDGLGELSGDLGRHDMSKIDDQKGQRTAMLLMALTILIDFTGFGLVIPLLPFWAERVGTNALGIGALISIYAVAQFLFTPMLGVLSDRHGRKPIIVTSILIEVIALTATALANSLPFLLCARFIGGIGASNIGSAQAVIADLTSPRERAKWMGMIGAAIGLGFVIGPALSGIMAPLGLQLTFFVAAGLAAVNAVLVIVFLPETRKRNSEQSKQARKANPFSIFFGGWRMGARYPLIVRLICVNLFYTLAFTGMESTFSLLTQRNFGWGAMQNGYVFTYVGVMIVIMQGGLIGRLVKRWNEQTLMLAGLILMALGLFTLPIGVNLIWTLIALGVLSIGDGAVSPMSSTLLSFATPADSQGEILGLSQGIGSLGRVFGPIIAGSLYTFRGPIASYSVAALLVIIAAILIYSSLKNHLKLLESAIHPASSGIGSTPIAVNEE